MASEPLRVKLLSPNARPPTRATEHSAGYDLFAAEDAVIDARTHMLVKTDIAIALSPQTYGRVAPRSGLALRHGVHVMAGVID
jgi:dUTP pyrophosphatase